MKLNTKITTAFATILLTMSMGAGAKIKGTDAAVRVDISDLDLTSIQGKELMESRIKRAAKQVCGSMDTRTAGSLENARKNRVCFDEAVTNAVTAVEHQYLTAFVEVSTVRLPQ